MKLLEKKEIYWKQRAKQFWLRDGDKNSRFFHKFASARKEHNKIQRLRDEQGVWRDKDEEIEQIITGYFENIFSTTATTEQMSDRNIFATISDDNVTLLFYQSLLKK